MRNKRAVTLIMLSITIAVMAILASTAVLYLEDTGIIGKAKKTAQDANLQQVSEVVKSAWNNANSTLSPTLEELEDAVEKAILKNQIDEEEYNIIVTMDNVYVSRDFDAPIITSSSMSYTNTAVTVDLGVGAIDEEDYPLMVEYYIKEGTSTEGSYSLVKDALCTEGTSISYTYTSLSPATAYSLQIVVRDINGNAATKTLSVTTAA